MPNPYLVGVDRPLDDPSSGSTIPLPPHRTGDILIVGVAHEEPTQAANVAISGFTRKIDHQNGFHSFQVWWRRAAADNEAPPTLTHTFSGGIFHAWEAIVATGCVASGDPFDVTGTQNTGGPTMTGPSVTTTVANCGVLLIGVAKGTVTFDTWTNATVNPREVADNIKDHPSHDMSMGMAWGHKATAGATGTWTVNIGFSVGGSTGTLALKPDGTGLPTTQAGYRDSTIASEPATGTTIALPAYAVGDLISIAVVGTDQAKTDAATLSGFTKRGLVEKTLGDAIAVFTRTAGSSETNPTITHTFGVTDDWVVIAFTIPNGLLVSWQREGSSGSTLIGTHDIEAAAPSLVVGICGSATNITFTSCTFADAGAATEREDGGPTDLKAALYTVEMPAAGWVGVPTWVKSSVGLSDWLTLTYVGTSALRRVGWDIIVR